MVVEITGVSIPNKKGNEIKITGNNLEQVFTADLYEAFEIEEVTFSFDKRTQGHMKYLWKICNSQKACDQAKSMGEKIEKLVGCILSIPDSFLA